MPYICPSLRQGILAKGHKLSGHGQLEKTYKIIKNKYYQEGLKSNIQLYLENCIKCAYFKNLSKQFSFVPIKISFHFHCVLIDMISPLPKTKHSNKFIILVIGHFTK